MIMLSLTFKHKNFFHKTCFHKAFFLKTFFGPFVLVHTIQFCHETMPAGLYLLKISHGLSSGQPSPQQGSLLTLFHRCPIELKTIKRPFTVVFFLYLIGLLTYPLTGCHYKPNYKSSSETTRNLSVLHPHNSGTKTLNLAS